MFRNPFRKRWALAIIRADGSATEVERYWLRSSALLAQEYVWPTMRQVFEVADYPAASIEVVRSA